jgi:hypothetical protein
LRFKVLGEGMDLMGGASPRPPLFIMKAKKNYEGLEGHEVTQFLFSDSYTHDNRVGFEISDYLDIKREALEKHMAGGVLSEEDIKDFMAETQLNDGDFEVLGYLSL